MGSRANFVGCFLGCFEAMKLLSSGGVPFGFENHNAESPPELPPRLLNEPL